MQLTHKLPSVALLFKLTCLVNQKPILIKECPSSSLYASLNINQCYTTSYATKFIIFSIKSLLMISSMESWYLKGIISDAHTIRSLKLHIQPLLQVKLYDYVSETLWNMSVLKNSTIMIKRKPNPAQVKQTWYVQHISRTLEEQSCLRSSLVQCWIRSGFWFTVLKEAACQYHVECVKLRGFLSGHKGTRKPSRH